MPQQSNQKQTSRCHQKHALKLDSTSKTAAVSLLQDINISDHPFQDYSATIPCLQDHKTIHNRKDLKSMFPVSFEKYAVCQANTPSHLTPVYHQFNMEGIEPQ